MAGIERAAQRVVLMRVAQPALMPSPRCLDSPPLGMMQLCHRESVVQFINEVPSPWPHSPRAAPSCVTPAPDALMTPSSPVPALRVAGV